MKGNSAAQKAAQRRQLQTRLQAIAASQHAADSGQICNRIRDQTVWQRAKAVMQFVPTRGEPDIWPLLRLALDEGKLVALPRYRRDNDAYEACSVTNLETDLVKGHHGIFEPSGHCAVVALNKLDLVLVPGIGFSPQGGRLGRGKGYYDRLLALVPGVKCGVGFDCQVTGDIPMEPHDVVLNRIVTPTRWLEVTRPARS